MMATYEELMAQAEELKQQANAVRQQEKQGVIAEIREKVARYGITAKELGLVGTRVAARSAGSGVRYRGPNGEIWNGKGRRPDWLKQATSAGRNKSDFAI
ncbi:histone family protein nucleoid-structuring protein H-NS [mine drainage metagenome]|uniref:Histone family protein nucleoid-structuring protein H-NS n=1 Tax=mine drainage metagenome TaxID=410659 RepID=T1D0K0_9ZZZZ|nr:H-NS histone family protein [Ferrovum myxofaciens]QKE41552.1 MAG: H-NS histone family protein [Ferrovum myxofaciens]